MSSGPLWLLIPIWQSHRQLEQLLPHVGVYLLLDLGRTISLPAFLLETHTLRRLFSSLATLKTQSPVGVGDVRVIWRFLLAVCVHHQLQAHAPWHMYMPMRRWSLLWSLWIPGRAQALSGCPVAVHRGAKPRPHPRDLRWRGVRVGAPQARPRVPSYRDRQSCPSGRLVGFLHSHYADGTYFVWLSALSALLLRE